MSDFRPMSLVTSLCKTAVIVLGERLRNGLSYTMDDTQMPFLERRQILDAILLPAESIDDLEELRLHSESNLLGIARKEICSLSWGGSVPERAVPPLNSCSQQH